MMRIVMWPAVQQRPVGHLPRPVETLPLVIVRIKVFNQ